MLPDRVSNPGPLTYESGALPIALRGPAKNNQCTQKLFYFNDSNSISNHCPFPHRNHQSFTLRLAKLNWPQYNKMLATASTVELQWLEH